MRHIFPKFEVGGNAELSQFCIAARRLLACDNFTSGKNLTKEDHVAIVAPLSEAERSFKASEPAGIKEALKQIYTA